MLNIAGTLMTTDMTTQTQPASDKQYGTIYKGSLIVPVLLIVLLAVLLWWFLNKRK
ncbi:hypothetical protein CLV58_102294 [Spirosoma oryzae]|uniref:Uncharacterized protein n=1 Tax=Spirosoma oryzae TaxID=1469603 RepID=A0A2T0TIU1_9BACT|nr:hypothetical protein CLV58_102294 [Spirosoma oryzae]